MHRPDQHHFPPNQLTASDDRERLWPNQPIAMREAADGMAVHWMEQVTDKPYRTGPIS